MAESGNPLVLITGDLDLLEPASALSEVFEVS